MQSTALHIWRRLVTSFIVAWKVRALARGGRSHCCLVVAVAATLCAAQPVTAQGVDIPSRRGSFTPGELALLPPYCKDIMFTPGYDGPDGARWRSLLGEDFQHFHHYCRGLRDVYFARTAQLSQRERRFLWERAISEYGYMIRNSRPTMVLLPEIFTRMGEAQLQLGQLIAAQNSFERARVLKPDYWPAYTIWADKLTEVGQIQSARELLEQALVHLPDNAEVITRLKRLRGQAKP